jgi:hypothetical protein
MTTFAIDREWLAGLRRPSPPSPAFDLGSIVTPFRAPEPSVADVAPLRRAAENIKQWTTLSDRALARAVGVTHPTVRALLTGERLSFVNRGDAARRLLMIEQIVSRLRRLSPDAASLATALQVPPAGSALSALGHIAQGNRGAAYVAALDVLEPRTTSGLLQPRFPPVQGATVALDEDG